jgi:hypothetical protein
MRGFPLCQELGRIGAVIGVAAQELPCPAARIEFHQIPIGGRKPRYIEPPHLIMVGRERAPVFKNSEFIF